MDQIQSRFVIYLGFDFEPATLYSLSVIDIRHFIIAILLVSDPFAMCTDRSVVRISIVCLSLETFRAILQNKGKENIYTTSDLYSANTVIRVPSHSSFTRGPTAKRNRSISH